MPTPRIFLLSPAHSAGRRAAILRNPAAEFELAVRLRSAEGAPLGEVFAFLSGLYFRGKMAYANRFGVPAPGTPAALVITTDRGLMDPATPVGPDDLEAFAHVPIDVRDPRYREPLDADARTLAARLPADAQVVLLGSVATTKYLEPVIERIPRRLFFPARFAGMGDMQRGSLMLRAAASGTELEYVPAAAAVRSRAVAK